MLSPHVFLKAFKTPAGNADFLPFFDDKGAIPPLGAWLRLVVLDLPVLKEQAT